MLPPQASVNYITSYSHKSATAVKQSRECKYVIGGSYRGRRRHRRLGLFLTDISSASASIY